MKKKFHYLSYPLQANAKTAVTYQPKFTSRLPVYNCYYNYYDPVKGYLFLYHPRAYISCFQKEINPLFYFTFLREYVFIFYAGIKIRR